MNGTLLDSPNMQSTFQPNLAQSLYTYHGATCQLFHPQIVSVSVHPAELSQMHPAENFPFWNQANTHHLNGGLPVLPFYPVLPSPSMPPQMQHSAYSYGDNLSQIPHTNGSLPTLPIYPIPQPSNIHPPFCPPQLCYASGQYNHWMPFGYLPELPTYQPPPNPPYPWRPCELQDNSNLFIFHLPSTTDESDLETLFRPFGTIVSTKLFRHAETRASRGFGFVAFDNPLSAQLAIQFMNGFPIENKKLFVHLKQPKAQPTAENQNEIVDLPLHFNGFHVNACSG